MKKYKILFLALFSVCLADTKIGYINSNVIMDEYEDVRQIQIELEKEQKRLEAIFKKNMASYDSLRQALQTGSIILSKEKLSQMENDLEQKGREIEEFQLKYFGPQGELYKMQETLLQPIIKAIYVAAENVGVAKKYDYIFDSVQGSILYALDTNDLTMDVLEELKKININKEKNN